MAWDRDLGDQPEPAYRDSAPEVLAPIDENAPVSGHHAPAEGRSPVDAPEQSWAAARETILPQLRPVDASGTRLADLDPSQLAAEGLRSHARPVVDDGPAGLHVAYVLQPSGFEVLVNADHLLAWGAPVEEVRAAAMANLAAWSETAAWTDEVSGHRRLISSANGGGADAARILLPDVRAHLLEELGGPGGHVLIGLPERDLLIAGSLAAGDDEFAALFAEFVRDHAAGADQPLDDRVLELVDGELAPFGGSG